jgi:pectate lyase
MRRLLTTSLFHLSLATWLWSASATDQPGGWASLNGGTRGGAGGMEVTVTTMADLQKYAKMEGKYIIWVKGTMGSAGTSGQSDGDRVVVASDKSILGLPGATVNGGFDIHKKVSNIILRNLKIQGPGAYDVDGLDAVHLESEAKNVWLDHLDISDGEDGNLDITHACDYITVSWTKFSYTSKSYPSGTSGKSHRYCNLIGHSDKNAAEDSGHLLITFYKTWWADGVAERMPRVRFAQVHIANCLFTSADPGQAYCIRACHRSNILAESNAFIGQKIPIDIAFDTTFTAITVKSNEFADCEGNTAGSGKSFTPTYAALGFTDPEKLQAEISDAKSGAGATLTWGTVTLASPRGSGSRKSPGVRIVDLAGRRLMPAEWGRDISPLQRTGLIAIPGTGPKGLNP